MNTLDKACTVAVNLAEQHKLSSVCVYQMWCTVHVECIGVGHSHMIWRRTEDSKEEYCIGSELICHKSKNEN